MGHTTPFGGTPNPKQSPQGLTEVAHMLAAGTITARIGSAVGLDAVPGVLKKLRDDDLHGKAVIRLQ